MSYCSRQIRHIQADAILSDTHAVDQLLAMCKVILKNLLNYLIYLYYLTSWAQLLFKIIDNQLPSYSYSLYIIIQHVSTNSIELTRMLYNSTLVTCNSVQLFGLITANQLALALPSQLQGATNAVCLGCPSISVTIPPRIFLHVQIIKLKALLVVRIVCDKYFVWKSVCVWCIYLPCVYTHGLMPQVFYVFAHVAHTCRDTRVPSKL